MEYVINGYEPEKLFRFFEQLSAIPRGSGNESAVADFVCDFAKKRGLEYIRDGKNNVFIRKAASEGYEDHEAVLLQGHLDMVCVKNGDVQHDFEKDPIRLVVENGWLRADGTTLGADDGVAVAMMLAILDDSELAHPPVECLFTVEEETGLGGALVFDTKNIKATKMINIDGDGEGTAIIGCAGSADVEVTFAPDYTDLYGRIMTVSLSDFAGGHSGGEIDKERVNAIVLLARLLSSMYEIAPFNIISIDGGSASNAIPSSAEAIIAVADESAVTPYIEEQYAKIKAEFTDADDAGKLVVRRTKPSELTASKMFTFKSTSKILTFITLAPCGILRRSKYDYTFVEASANLASVHITEDRVKIAFMNRSSIDISQKYMYEKIFRLARLTGGEAKITGSYPAWEPVYGTDFQKLYIDTFEELFPTLNKPNIIHIHMGLECGVIADNMISERGSGIDAIAIGANVLDIHTPDERLELASLERLWKLVTAILKKL